MAISIKDPEVDAKVRRVAELAHESITEAVSKAMDTRLVALEREMVTADEEQVNERVAILKEFQKRFSKLEVLDPRPHGEILYDEDGLPA